jgi:hydroxymethylpyrimidine/phosphomethylpyrimidine kinase
MADAPLKLLTIGGSDSGGAAGIQADLRTFAALGAYGMSALTVVTAQNSVDVTMVHKLPPSFLAAQLEAVLGDYGAAGIKTGFIGHVDLLEIAATHLAAYRNAILVVDPVLVNHRGESMFSPAVTAAYRSLLLPLARLATPNRREAELLAGGPVATPADAERAAQALSALGPGAVLIKGVPDGEHLVDLLWDGEHASSYRAKRLDTENTHGAGDAYAAAALTYLAAGADLASAVARAHAFVQAGIRRGADWRLGAGHGPIGVGGSW